MVKVHLSTDFCVGIGVGAAAATAYYAFYANPTQVEAAEVVSTQSQSVLLAPAAAHDLSRYISTSCGPKQEMLSTDVTGFYEMYPQHRRAFKKLKNFCNAYPELLTWVVVPPGKPTSDVRMQPPMYPSPSPARAVPTTFLLPVSVLISHPPNPFLHPTRHVHRAHCIRRWASR